MSTPQSAKRLIGTRAVGQRYGGKHPRTVKRWKDQGVIPPPDLRINGRDYWDETTLDHHDRTLVAAGADRKPL